MPLFFLRPECLTDLLPQPSMPKWVTAFRQHLQRYFCPVERGLLTILHCRNAIFWISRKLWSQIKCHLLGFHEMVPSLKRSSPFCLTLPSLSSLAPAGSLNCLDVAIEMSATSVFNRNIVRLGVHQFAMQEQTSFCSGCTGD